MAKRRVVITGMGIVSPVGNSISQAWDNLLKSKSGICRIEHFDPSDMNTQIMGAVKNFDPLLSLNIKDARKVDTFIQYSVEATRQALEDSKLIVSDQLSPRVGVAVGSGIGGLPFIEKNYDALLKGGQRKVSPFFIPGCIINMAPGFISMKYNCRGPNISIVSACTTGSHNIGHAARMIQHGDADVMVAGGTEMASTKLGLSGFSAARALSTRNDEPEKASRPWDRDRDGFVLAEGAGILILEEYEFAKKRGAHIYAELIGFGMSGDAYHMTSPDPEGVGFVIGMQNTLNDAHMKPENVDYINAHATATLIGDIIEIAAVKKVFGEHAYKLAMSSTKSMTGHLLGAAGAVEAIFSILAIRDQIAPPTINLDHPDEGCDIDLIPHHARKMKIEVALSNSFGFGGTNGSLLFRSIE